MVRKLIRINDTNYDLALNILTTDHSICIKYIDWNKNIKKIIIKEINKSETKSFMSLNKNSNMKIKKNGLKFSEAFSNKFSTEIFSFYLKKKLL